MAIKTITVKRKNVFLDIAPEQVEKYKAKGYDVVDTFGNVIEKCIPNDPQALKKAYDKQVVEIVNLKAKIQKLEAQLKAKSQAPTKDETKVEEIAEAKPKSSGKKTKKSV